MQLLPLLLLMTATTLTVIAADENADEVEVEMDLEEEVLHEIIADGRGERDNVGVRDQWSSTEHLRESSKVDVRKGKPISAKVKGLLRDYRLECDGCDHEEAVVRINAFVLDTKRHAEQQTQHQTWLERAAMFVSVVALGTGVFLFSSGMMGSTKWNNMNIGSAAGGGGSSLVDRQRRGEIAEERRRVAMKEEESAVNNADAKRRTDTAPSWFDNEETEVWTPKQEKQFAKALVAFGGIPPKERYPLIAAKVDDKTKQECLMHHKLQQFIAKEQ